MSLRAEQLHWARQEGDVINCYCIVVRIIGSSGEHRPEETSLSNVDLTLLPGTTLGSTDFQGVHWVLISLIQCTNPEVVCKLGSWKHKLAFYLNTLQLRLYAVLTSNTHIT